MKRFKWPLQRLLDVTAQREQWLRREMLELSGRIAELRQDAARRRAVLRAALAELGALQIGRRLASQETVMACAAVKEEEIRGIRDRVEALELQRAEKKAQFLQARASRQSLEKLREQARQRYLREQARLEQKELDDRAQVTFARKVLERRRLPHPLGA